MFTYLLWYYSGLIFLLLLVHRYKRLQANCVRLPAVTSSLRTKKKWQQLSLLREQGINEDNSEPCYLPTLTRGKSGATALEVNSSFSGVVPSFASTRSQSLRKCTAGKLFLNSLQIWAMNCSGSAEIVAFKLQGIKQLILIRSCLSIQNFLTQFWISWNFWKKVEKSPVMLNNNSDPFNVLVLRRHAIPWWPGTFLS